MMKYYGMERKRNEGSGSILARVSPEYNIENMHPAMSSQRDVQGLLRTAVSRPPLAIQSIVCGPSDLRVSATCTTATVWRLSVSRRERVSDG